MEANSSMLRLPSGSSLPSGCSSAHARYLCARSASGLTVGSAVRPSRIPIFRHGSMPVRPVGVKIWPMPKTATRTGSSFVPAKGSVFSIFLSSTQLPAAAARLTRACSFILAVYSMAISRSYCTDNMLNLSYHKKRRSETGKNEKSGGLRRKSGKTASLYKKFTQRPREGI